MKGITDMTYTKKTTENLRRLAALSDERNGILPDMYTEHTAVISASDPLRWSIAKSRTA